VRARTGAAALAKVLPLLMGSLDPLMYRCSPTLTPHACELKFFLFGDDVSVRIDVCSMVGRRQDGSKGQGVQGRKRLHLHLCCTCSGVCSARRCAAMRLRRGRYGSAVTPHATQTTECSEGAGRGQAPIYIAAVARARAGRRLVEPAGTIRWSRCDCDGRDSRDAPAGEA
jgi:hypothetical protein